MSSALINSIGLAFDIVGVILVFRFGVAAMLDAGGGGVVVSDNVSPEGKAEDERIKFWSRMGLGCLVLGFSLQLLSNWVGVDRFRAAQAAQSVSLPDHPDLSPTVPKQRYRWAWR